MNGGVVSTGDHLATVGLDALIIAAGGALTVAAEPSGAGALAFAYVTPLAIMNIRSPGPFHEADGAWTNLGGAFADLAGDLDRLRGEIAPLWDGVGHEAFDEFIRTRLVAPLESLTEAALGAAGGCNTIAGALWIFFSAWLAATVAATVGCVIANGSGPAAPGIKWGIVGTWVAFCTAVLGGIVALMTQASSANGAVSGAVEQLKRGFEIEEGRIHEEALAMDAAIRDIVADPESWTRPAVLPGER